MKKVWRDIPGFEKRYQASSLGRIRSLNRFTIQKRRSKIISVKYPGKILKIDKKINNGGYYIVTLLTNGERLYRSVHRLVCLTFRGNPPEYGMQVNHINGNKLDNKISNLEWVSPSKNIQHALSIGCFDKHIKNMSKKNRGELNPRSKLTKNKVINIREALNSGMNSKALALMYDVTPHTISNIKRGVTWK